MLINTLCLQSLGHQHQEQLLFSGVSYELKDGDLLLITGNNGSGKSTLLQILTGLKEATSGKVTFNQQNIFNHPLYQTHIHYIGHQTGLKSGLTVLENIKLSLLLHHVSSFAFHHIIRTLQLDALLNKTIRQLSAGQQRRVALAKLFLIKKPIWLLDEPLTALDQTTQQFLQLEINAHCKARGIAIVSSHQTLLHINQPIHQLSL